MFSLGVKTFVVEAKDYAEAFKLLDKQVNSFLFTHPDKQILIENEKAIHDTFLPPITQRDGGFARVARRVVYKAIWRH